MVGLTKKTENLPAQKPGITTSTGPQVSTPPPLVLHLPLVHVPTNTMQFPQPVASHLILHSADSKHLAMGSDGVTVLQHASCVMGQYHAMYSSRQCSASMTALRSSPVAGIHH